MFGDQITRNQIEVNKNKSGYPESLPNQDEIFNPQPNVESGYAKEEWTQTVQHLEEIK